MLKNILSKFNTKKLFQGEEARFLLSTSFKISGVYLFTALFVVYLIWLILAINNVFFEANGFLDIPDLRSAYFDFITSRLMQNFIYIFILFVFLFFTSLYLGKILLRPFKIIGEYCDEAVTKKNTSYNPDIFSDFKLLTRFSDFFFQYVLESRNKKKFTRNTIPPTFTKIHGPVFDKVFFFHFVLFISIIAISSSILIVAITTDTYDSLIELALKTLPKNGKEVAYFFKNQKYIFDSILWYSITLLVLFYSFLAFHLYSKVSGAVFGFFSTMRSFMKGNYKARVHLVGYPHIRPFSRSFNKYLDSVCRELENETES